MLTIVDEMVLNVLLALCVGLFAFVGLTIIILLRSPKAVKTIIQAWLSHKILCIEVTLDGVMRFRARKRRADGQLECMVDGQKSIKIIPNNPDPALAVPAHLEGSGVKAFLAAEPKTIAVTPNTLLAIEMVEKKDTPEEIPQEFLDWGKRLNIKGEKLVKLFHQAGRKAKGKEGEPKPEKLYILDARKLISYFPDTYDEGAYRNMLEREGIEAEKRVRSEKLGMNKSVLWLVLIVGVVVMVVLAWLMLSGGNLQVPGVPT